MTSPQIAVVVPAAPGLLPCRGATDPFADTRDAAVGAIVAALPGIREVGILGTAATETEIDRGIVMPLGLRVAHHLLNLAGWEGPRHESVLPAVPLAGELLVIPADGSARRSEKAPGYLDPRAIDFDAAVEAALESGDGAALAALDPELGADLLALGVPALQMLAGLMPEPSTAKMLYADDPFGVRYWVARWED